VKKKRGEGRKKEKRAHWLARGDREEKERGKGQGSRIEVLKKNASEDGHRPLESREGRRDVSRHGGKNSRGC